MKHFNVLLPLMQAKKIDCDLRESLEENYIDLWMLKFGDVYAKAKKV